MRRVTVGFTLIREFGLFCACLADDERLAAIDPAVFQDATIRDAIEAAKRSRIKPTMADSYVIREAFAKCANVTGDGKALDRLAASVAGETVAAGQRRAVRNLSERIGSMGPEEIASALAALTDTVSKKPPALHAPADEPQQPKGAA